MEKICYIFILFIIYSFLGWIVEILDIFITKGKIVNRGFLIGPYCPIYGVGLLLIINLLKNYTDSIIVLFILSACICMILEYLTSYFMEKLFHARWWDFSDSKFNLNGRICLETTIPFGLGGVFIMYVVNPFFTGLLNKLSSKETIIIGLILFIIFLTDTIVSFFIISRISKIDTSKYKDDTEEVNKKITEYLKKTSPLMKRLLESFPNARIKINKLKNKLEDKRDEVVKKIKSNKKK